MMIKVILIGMKSSGKSIIGKLLSERLAIPCIDVDVEIEQRHKEQTGKLQSFRKIYHEYGKEYFRNLEYETLLMLHSRLKDEEFVLSTGGGLPLAEENRRILSQIGTIVFLDVAASALLPRITQHGVPAFFPYPDNLEKSLDELLMLRRPIYLELATLIMPCSAESPSMLVEVIVSELTTHNHYTL